MSTSISRRAILKFFGASAASVFVEPLLSEQLSGAASEAEAASSPGLSFTPVRLPHPLPLYQQHPSFLASGIGQGTTLPAAANTRLASYTVIDDVVVPPEYERYVIAHWGDRVYPNADDYFGYNADYTGFVPIVGDDNDDDDNDDDGQGHKRKSSGYLWVNHEYVSYPISTLAPATPKGLANSPTTDGIVLGFNLPVGSAAGAETLAGRLAGLAAAERRLLYGEFLYNVGGSVLVISRRNRHDRWRVEEFHDRNRRIHGLSGLAINAERKDDYKTVTTWGGGDHEEGDNNYLIGTGPAANEVFTQSSDGLGNRIIGTAYSCSGETTPWGTILSAEENFQGSTTGDAPQFLGVQENVLPNGTQTGYLPSTAGVVATGTEFGLVGEKYGWMVEIDPAAPDWRPRKHTWLGRWRHENSPLRVRKGEKIVAYMGDDKRGGHTWKFVSNDSVVDEKSKKNSALLESGKLFVARYNADGSGQWIPVALDTPTAPLRPSDLSSIPFAAGFTTGALAAGRIRLPRRKGVAAETADGGSLVVERSNEAAAFQPYPAGYLNTTLASFYPNQGAILCDAFLAGNLAGGTPTARPEDIEINPRNEREVFIAFTDGAPGGDGYPDSRIFQVAKLSAKVDATQQSGGLYKIIEESNAGLKFRWERLEQGGEVGASASSGFAAIDNLVFDKHANVWGVTDMSTGLHNGFTEGFPNEPTVIDHTRTGDVSSLIGVFGNNWLFYIPTSGRGAGEVIAFAYGPTRCEMTGPTFVKNTLIIAVQHPGEDCLIAPATLNRDIEMLDLDGKLFTQNRTVPRGSNWPSNMQGLFAGPPRPCVIGIQRKDGKPFV